MKLIAAKISNFRLLKALELDFSTESDKKLTVVRAANETGKTTCLNALLWCLYGSKALPQKGHYSLFPSDDKEKLDKVEISVEIDFEVELVESSQRGGTAVKKNRYKLERSCREYSEPKNGQFREHEDHKLWKFSPNGVERVSDSQVKSIIEATLPESLRNVYFTDGDSAMSFIEAAASQGQKRQRVESAIQSLLGLTVLDSTVKHLSATAKRFSQEVDNTDYAKEIEDLNDKIASYEDDIEEWTDELESAREEIKDLDDRLRQVNSKREELLKLGNKSSLVERKNKAQRVIEDQQKNEKISYKRLAQLAYGGPATKALLEEPLSAAQAKLNGLNKTKQLPKVNIPILEELLERTSCFCGSELDGVTSSGVSRREAIKKSIEDSRESDAVQEAGTSLFYAIRSIDSSSASKSWIETYSSLMEELQHCSNTITKTEEELEEIEVEIKALDDSQLQELTQHKSKLEESHRIALSKEARKSSHIEEKQERKADAEFSLSRLRAKLGKTNNSALTWDLTKEVREIFKLIIERLKKDELTKVSTEMNRIFLAMIGQEESNERSLIHRAELTEEFDIVVYGPNNHLLNPDQDLNGASRRAITLSFILALTKVSEVEAPNIIDTPLGMMSGYVKQSVLLNIVKEGSQPILFLTHDEIKGVEDLIDRYAGKVFTLTNPTHFPTMLANKPPENVVSVIRCECNHHSSCSICERKLLEL